jgi:hypothetical protein
MEMDTETITKNNFPNPSMDFFGLRNSAIEFLQKLAGEEWTDFNEHDPGVTILDQLCYAITDLSYRTNYDIRDLLAGKPEYCGREKDTVTNDPREISRDSFFTLNEVMPCHPLTINDWRRFIIDKVDNARNVWIEPLAQDHRHPIGLYRILVEVNQLVEEKDYAEIIGNVTKVFHEHRNLCEDLESVKILTKRNVKIIASVEVDEKMNSEETLALIFFKVEEFLTHPIRMYTLPQMLEKGYTIGSIFNGPRLDNGFILDDELYPRILQIYYSRLIRVILEVPGVKNVYNFSIEGADEDKKALLLGEMEVPFFDIQPSNSTGEYGIKLLKNHIPVYIENNLVNSFYQAFKLGQPKSFVPGQHQQALRTFDVQLGRDRKVGEYRSVQYDFPPIYGIGEFGVGDNVSDTYISEESSGKKRSSTRRMGLARQLKGYLLVFDQMLANYLEQLASVPILFSIKPDITRSYFPARQLDVPGLEPLQKKKDTISGQSNIDHELYVMEQAQLMFSSELSYDKALDNIVTAQDEFFRRRNQFLDHLLARFGIFMPSRMFEDANWYFTTEEELREFILTTKAAALQYIDLVTERRGQAPMLLYDIAISWLECYIQLRLGIVDARINFRLRFSKLAKPLFKYKIRLSKEPLWKNNKKREIHSPHGKIESEIAESEHFHSYDEPEKPDDHKAFRNIHFLNQLRNEHFHIDIDMFRNGYLANNYRFGHAEKHHKKISVIYRDPEDNTAGEERSWKVVALFDNRREAVKGILSLSSFIRYLNIETEGLHLVEHLPLRPSTDQLKFETQLLDSSRQVLLQSDEPFSCEEEQEQIVRKFLAAGCRPTSYVIKQEKKSNHWLIELVDADHKTIATSVKHFHSEREGKATAELIMQHCIDLFIRDSDHIQYFRFRTLHPEGEIPLLSFYSFRMTVVMPSWTARFINSGFRETISMLLRNYAPAHSSIGEFWLEPAEMREFEILYQQWRKAMMVNDTSKESIAVKLGVLINQYYFSDSHY